MRNYFINYHYLWMNWLKIRDKEKLIKNEKSESISVSTIRALKHDKKMHPEDLRDEKLSHS